MAEHLRTCHLCEAMCGLVIEHDDGEPRAVRGDPDDPHSRGYVCPKATALIDVHRDPDRLRVAHRRVDGRLEPMPWGLAFDEVAARLRAVQARHGRDAVAVYVGNPAVHNWSTALLGVAFTRALGTKQRYSATSLDQLPHMLAALEMFGHQLLLPVPDVDRTEYLLVFGANPVVSGGSLLSGAGMPRRLKALTARGGKLVVFDPRRTETAELATEHHFVRPGTDAAVLAAIAREIVRRGPRLRGLAGLTTGLERLHALVEPFTPERVAPVAGVSADAICRVAAELLGHDRAIAYGRLGVSTQAFGGLCQWLLMAINVLTGNLDRPGGVMFARPAVDLVSLATRIGQRGRFGRRRSKARGLPEFSGELPAAGLADEIEAGHVRALVTSCGNPVLSVPNGGRLERALGSLELVVSIDLYENETTRFAHYLLPPTFGVEKDHFDVVLGLLAVRNGVKYSRAIRPRRPEARHDHEIFAELLARLARPGLARLLPSALLRRAPERALDVLLRFGPYGRGLRPGGLDLGTVLAHPHGLDLGPLEPRLPGVLETPDRKIHLAPDVFAADIPRLERSLAAPPPRLALIGRRERASNNSWLHNVERLGGGKGRGALLVHPDDARAHGVGSGDRLELRSRTGSVVAEVEVSDRVMPGVVSLPHGYGHARPGVRLSVASRLSAPSMNDVTDDALVDELTGTAQLSRVPVELRALPGRDPSGPR